MADIRVQLHQDIQFLQPFINDNTRFAFQHKDRLIAILRRLAQRGALRGGPSKQMLLDITPLLPGNANFNRLDNKATIIAGLLQMVALVQDVPNQPNQPAIAPNQPNQPVVEAEGRAEVPAVAGNNNNVQQIDADGQRQAGGNVPAGWERFFNDHGNDDGEEEKTLLKLRRKSISESPHKMLQLLLSEQEQAVQAKEQGDQAYLTYVKENLQEMAENPNPLPQNTEARFVWAIYLRVLQVAIDEAAAALDVGEETHADVDDPPELVEASSSESDSDLDSYAPKKRFAPTRYKSRKRKKKKRSKKRRKKRQHSDSESASSSSSDEEEPNSKRVKSAAYDGTHLERLTEFRDEHKEYLRNGRVGWPTDEALSFIAKKFARAGTKFAAKGNKGVKRVFGANMAEKEHARVRASQIYEMADEVCALRLERNERMADFARRKSGATEAKKARIRDKARKCKLASVREEQALVSKVSLYCDLVLLGKAAWEAYHSELDLRGQQMTVVESLGGTVSRSVAAKAWKAATKCAFTPSARKKPGGGLPPSRQKQYGADRKKLPCYWCNKRGHQGRSCPDKLSGKPFHPDSRAASWPDNRLAAVTKGRQKPNPV